MTLLLTLAFLFLIGSVTGWILELLYRRFLSEMDQSGISGGSLSSAIRIQSVRIISDCQYKCGVHTQSDIEEDRIISDHGGDRYIDRIYCWTYFYKRNED